MIETETFTGVRSFRAEDMVWVIENGVKEFGLKILSNDHIRDLAQARESNGQCVTGVVNDKIVGCGGVDMIFEGVGEVWVMLTYEVDKYPIRVYEVIKEGLGKLINDNGLWRTEAWCRKGFAKGHTLFRHLGFKAEGIARKRSPDGIDSILYAIVRD